jgi:hypothetical protein
MPKLATAYYLAILILFGAAWQQGYSVSDLFSSQQRGAHITGQHNYHK